MAAPRMNVGSKTVDKSALKAAASGGAAPAAQKAAPQKVNRNPTGYVAPARQGKKALSAYFEPEVIDALKIMAIEQGTSVQALATEALNDLFTKHGKPPIA